MMILLITTLVIFSVFFIQQKKNQIESTGIEDLIQNEGLSFFSLDFTTILTENTHSSTLTTMSSSTRNGSLFIFY